MSLPARSTVSLVALLLGLAAGAPAAEGGEVRRLAGAAPSVLELPAAPSARPGAVVVSGAAGWGRLEDEVALVFVAHRMPVLGVTHGEILRGGAELDPAARELGDLVQPFLERWERRQVVLVGYREGAALLPFLVNRLPAEARRSILALALLSPPATLVAAEPLLTSSADPTPAAVHPVGPEVGRLGDLKVLCLYGELEGGEPPTTWLPVPRGRVHAFPCGVDLCDAWEAVTEVVIKSSIQQGWP